MKKNFLFICFVLLSCFSLAAQNPSESFTKLYARFKEMAVVYEECRARNDYEGMSRALKEQIALLEKVEPAGEGANDREMREKLLANQYYNLACAYALKSKSKAAVEAFRKAVEHGFKNYRHTCNDPDLASIREDRRFRKLLGRIIQYDNLHMLRTARSYRREQTDSLPKFTYQSASDHNLKAVRERFRLDSIAGSGDEVSKIMNVMTFVHNNIRHDGSNYALCEFNANDIYNYHKATGMGVNCRHLAMMLNEMYLSLGIPSRYVTCMPKDPNDGDCHVIVAVYSAQLGKWLWIDPSFNAYVKDENGHLLSIAEVRERLIDGRPVVLNEDANWNNKVKQTKEEYLENYMAKNLYYFICAEQSRFNAESRYRYTGIRYVALLPEGFETQSVSGDMYTVTSDAEYFWQPPSSAK